MTVPHYQLRYLLVIRIVFRIQMVAGIYDFYNLTGREQRRGVRDIIIHDDHNTSWVVQCPLTLGCNIAIYSFDWLSPLIILGICSCNTCYGGKNSWPCIYLFVSKALDREWHLHFGPRRAVWPELLRVASKPSQWVWRVLSYESYNPILHHFSQMTWWFFHTKKRLTWIYLIQDTTWSRTAGATWATARSHPSCTSFLSNTWPTRLAWPSWETGSPTQWCVQVTPTKLTELARYSLSTTTVKAPNFGPHGNFGPLFQKGLLSLKRILQKDEEKKSWRNTLDLQICFCSYLVHDSSKNATELAKKVQSFHEVRS